MVRHHISSVVLTRQQLTALTEHILNENPELGQKWTSLIPQGKMGRPSDLMGPVSLHSSNHDDETAC